MESVRLLFFFNDTATTEIYTLSLHDALPIFPPGSLVRRVRVPFPEPSGYFCTDHVIRRSGARLRRMTDRKSTRLNSSHANISYAVFCLKKKKTKYSIIYSYTTILFLSH